MSQDLGQFRQRLIGTQFMTLVGNNEDDENWVDQFLKYHNSNPATKFSKFCEFLESKNWKLNESSSPERNHWLETSPDMKIYLLFLSCEKLRDNLKTSRDNKVDNAKEEQIVREHVCLRNLIGRKNHLFLLYVLGVYSSVNVTNKRNDHRKLQSLVENATTVNNTTMKTTKNAIGETTDVATKDFTNDFTKETLTDGRNDPTNPMKTKNVYTSNFSLWDNKYEFMDRVEKTIVEFFGYME